jgi:hypothetical protein
MTIPAGVEVLDARTRRWQISLADLIVLVLTFSAKHAWEAFADYSGVMI